jgi:hypothetical protein
MDNIRKILRYNNEIGIDLKSLIFPLSGKITSNNPFSSFSPPSMKNYFPFFNTPGP